MLWAPQVCEFVTLTSCKCPQQRSPAKCSRDPQARSKGRPAVPEPSPLWRSHLTHLLPQVFVSQRPRGYRRSSSAFQKLRHHDVPFHSKLSKCLLRKTTLCPMPWKTPVVRLRDCQTFADVSCPQRWTLTLAKPCSSASAQSWKTPPGGKTAGSWGAWNGHPLLGLALH